MLKNIWLQQTYKQMGNSRYLKIISFNLAKVAWRLNHPEGFFSRFETMETFTELEMTPWERTIESELLIWIVLNAEKSHHFRYVSDCDECVCK